MAAKRRELEQQGAPTPRKAHQNWKWQTRSIYSGESDTEAESGDEPEPAPAAPSLVPSQVVKKGHSTAAVATKARR